MRFLIARGARTDGDIGAAALHEAATFGQVNIVRLLLAHRADMNTRDDRGDMPLHAAAFCGRADVVELLLSRGANPNVKGRDGLSPLHNAMRDGHADVARCLIEHGADVNAKDADGETPLLIALRYGRTEAAKVLIAAGADRVNLPNLPHDASLHTALDANDTELVDLLLANGADVELRNTRGLTALHVAAKKGEAGVVRSLLAHGADPGATNWIGMTALHYAAAAGHKEAVLLLLANGAQADRKNVEGNTPEHLARGSGHDGIAELLAAQVKMGGGPKRPSEQTVPDGLRVELSDAARARRNVAVLVRDNSAFALELNRRLGSGGGNVFFSPHSISTALAMTYAAARATTEREMADVIHFSLDQQDLHPAFAALQGVLEGIQRAGNVKLYVANSLWPQQRHPFLDEYLSLVKTHYGASITPVDYGTAAARQITCRTINTWVQDRTQGIIRDLIDPGLLDSTTRLVLANAAYFKGNWSRPFDPNKTKEGLFHVTAERSVPTKLMNRNATFEYLEVEGLQVLRLPYRGDELSMLILLPKEVQGLAELEGRLSVEDIDFWRHGLRPQYVIVSLPKFKITFETQLKSVLQAMGMVEAFKWPGANFAGFDGDPRWFFIDAVVHKAFVEVNEEGTEAAAATAVASALGGTPPPPPVFRADHPFLFLIQENRTGSILFLGRLTAPTAPDGQPQGGL